jgi:hypothetical protein
MSRASIMRERGKKKAYKILVSKPGGKNHLGDLSVDGSITLKHIIKE